MKILVLGEPSSFWQKEFIENVLIPMGAKVFVQENLSTGTEYQKFYNNVNATIIPFEPLPKWIMAIPKFRALVMAQKQKKALAKYAPYDVIINMFVDPSALYKALAVKKKTTKIFAYFCGSDIIRASSVTCLSLIKRLKKLDGVVFASSSVEDAYNKKLANAVKKPCTTIRLGLSSFEYIDKKADQKSDCKSELNIKPSKTTVCIGYNASKAQNHLAVLEQLQQLPKETLDNITVLLQMTYSGDNEYIAKVENAVKKIGCDYKLMTEFLDLTQIAKLRLATDIFINAQTTDGLSASVLEAMYAGAVLINGSWLSYGEYDEWGIDYESFANFEQLPELILKNINNTKNNKNHNILKNKMSWKTCLDAWVRKMPDESALY